MISFLQFKGLFLHLISDVPPTTQLPKQFEPNVRIEHDVHKMLFKL
jgi:hypothetical protein